MKKLLLTFLGSLMLLGALATSPIIPDGSPTGNGSCPPGKTCKP